MPTAAASKPAFAGLNLADDLKDFEVDEAPDHRPKPDAAALADVSERAGFPSREPKASKPAPAPAPVREIIYGERLTLRVTKKDRERFDEIAYRLRGANGEAFARILDAFELQEQAAKRGGE